MQSRALMTTSAVYLLGTGVVLTFLSQEVAALAGLAEASAGPLLLQLVAALYLGMGFTNWMWRLNLVGGIYGRPIGVGNVVHFTVGAFALGRAAVGSLVTPAIWPIVWLYVLFALAFAWIIFYRNPLTTGAGGQVR
jgi:hypothetical protein